MKNKMKNKGINVLKELKKFKRNHITRDESVPYNAKVITFLELGQTYINPNKIEKNEIKAQKNSKHIKFSKRIKRRKLNVESSSEISSINI